MAIVLANADGTVYHRYGGRTDVSPMNISTLIDVMQRGLKTHHMHQSIASQPPTKQTLKVNQLVDQQLKGFLKPTFACIHCHNVREAKQYSSMESGNWNPAQFWIWPSTKQIGLIMDQNHLLNWLMMELNPCGCMKTRCHFIRTY